MLVEEQQESQKKTAELNSATRYIANLQDQVMKVQMESYTETGKLRKKISNMAWARAGMRRQLVAIIGEKNRASTDAACRHAELQNEIAVLNDALSTLRKVKREVSVRERDRLVKAHTDVLEARNRDSRLQFERVRRRVQELDDEWEARLIAKESEEDVLGERELVNTV